MDNETVMMSIENGEYYGINSVGSRIWELLDQPRSILELTDLLLEEFDVPENECQQDVMEFVEKLVEKKLLIVL